jgi:hypothetical protein
MEMENEKLSLCEIITANKHLSAKALKALTMTNKEAEQHLADEVHEDEIWEVK